VRGSDFVITLMITDRVGLHSVLLPLLIAQFIYCFEIWIFTKIHFLYTGEDRKDSVYVQNTFNLLGDHFGLISMSYIVSLIFIFTPTKSH